MSIPTTRLPTLKWCLSGEPKPSVACERPVAQGCPRNKCEISAPDTCPPTEPIYRGCTNVAEAKLPWVRMVAGDVPATVVMGMITETRIRSQQVSEVA